MKDLTQGAVGRQLLTMAAPIAIGLVFQSHASRALVLREHARDAGDL
jgi:hypothetical protein